MVGKALKFPTGMTPHVLGGIAHLCLQLPPQSWRSMWFPYIGPLFFVPVPSDGDASSASIAQWRMIILW